MNDVLFSVVTEECCTSTLCLIESRHINGREEAPKHLCGERPLRALHGLATTLSFYRVCEAAKAVENLQRSAGVVSSAALGSLLRGFDIPRQREAVHLEGEGRPMRKPRQLHVRRGLGSREHDQVSHIVVRRNSYEVLNPVVLRLPQGFRAVWHHHIPEVFHKVLDAVSNMASLQHEAPRSILRLRCTDLFLFIYRAALFPSLPLTRHGCTEME
mmetsp:Transcript_75714/g.136551  ORF Transcript_75714/g.136551 Transcript_75714/m.136551 type:complete len:214 (-) Transcript_75714:49-690(-)